MLENHNLMKTTATCFFVNQVKQNIKNEKGTKPKLEWSETQSQINMIKGRSTNKGVINKGRQN